MSGSSDLCNPDASIPVYLGSNPGGSQPSPTSQGDEMAAIPVYIVPQANDVFAMPVRFVTKPSYPSPFPNDQSNDDSAIPVFIVNNPGAGGGPVQKWNPLSAIPVWNTGEMQPGTPQPDLTDIDDGFVWGSEYVQSVPSTIIRVPQQYGAATIPPPVFAPPLLANLTVWLSGGAGLLNSSGLRATSGQGISTWKDQSGNGNDFVAGTVSPTLHANALNGIDGAAFNGTSQWLKCLSTGFGANPFTIVWCRNRTNVNPTYQPVLAENPAVTHYFAIGAANNSAGYFTGVAGSSNGNSLLAEPVGSFSIGSAFSLGGSPPNEQGVNVVDAQFRVNGVNAPQYSSTNAATNGFVSNVGLGKDGAGDYFIGDFMELLYYKRALSNYEIYQVENYLATKYALPYPARHKYDRTTFAGMITQGLAIPPGPASWDASFTDSPTFIYVPSKNRYYAMYNGCPTAGGNTPVGIGLASGPSLGALAKVGTTAAIPFGFASWCSGNIYGPRLFQDPISGNVYVYFGGGASVSFEGGPNMGVAQITDLDTPTIVDVAGVNPILSTNSNTWENTEIYRPCMIYNPFNSTYYLYYNSKGTVGGESISFATSSSPTGPFTRHVGNPVLTNGASRAGDPMIIQPDPSVPYWVMWSLWGAGTSTAMFYSTDLINWTPDNNSATVQVVFSQPPGGTAPFPLSRMDVRLGAGNQWVALSDNGGAPGTAGYACYWHTLVHDPYS
jgi:hypothetical protein